MTRAALLAVGFNSTDAVGWGARPAGPRFAANRVDGFSVASGLAISAFGATTASALGCGAAGGAGGLAAGAMVGGADAMTGIVGGAILAAILGAGGAGVEIDGAEGATTGGVGGAIGGLGGADGAMTDADGAGCAIAGMGGAIRGAAGGVFTGGAAGRAACMAFVAIEGIKLGAGPLGRRAGGGTGAAARSATGVSNHSCWQFAQRSHLPSPLISAGSIKKRVPQLPQVRIIRPSTIGVFAPLYSFITAWPGFGQVVNKKKSSGNKNRINLLRAYRS